MARQSDFALQLITEEEVKNFQLGIPVSESEDDYSESASVGVATPDPIRYNRGYESRNIRIDTEVALMKEQIDEKRKQAQMKARFLQDENQKLRDQFSIKERQFRNEMRAYSEMASEKLEEVKTKQRKLQQEAPIIKERIDSLKETIGDFKITESTYLELKKTPEELRPIRDWILVRVYELTSANRIAAEKARKEVDILRENLLLTTEKWERSQRELTHKETTSKALSGDLDRHNSELTTQLKVMQTKLNEALARAEENKEKADKFTLMQSSLRKAEEERARSTTQLDAGTSQVQQLLREKDEIYALAESRRKDIDLLTSDKSYLSRENSSLVDKIHKLEERNDRLEIDLMESKNATQDYLNKLLNAKTDKAATFEEKLTRELSEMRERHNKELESSKSALNEIHERRVEYLKESKEEAEVRLSKTEQDLKDKSSAYEELLLESRTIQGRLEQTLIEIRSELRMKSDELERTMLKYEDMVSGSRQAGAENTMLKDKVDILKQEFYKLENRNKADGAELKAAHAIAKERLSQYEAMEQDIDKAITTQGLEIAAPTMAKRRVKHSLELAGKLQAVSLERDSLSAEVEKLRDRANILERELSIKEDLLTHIDAPTSALIGDIEAHKREIRALTAQQTDLLALLREKQEESAGFKHKSDALEADLKVIVEKQSTLKELPKAKLQTGQTVKAQPKWLQNVKKTVKRF